MSSRRGRFFGARLGSSVSHVLNSAVDSVASVALTREQRVYNEIERQVFHVDNDYNQQLDLIEASIDQLTAQEKDVLRRHIEGSTVVLPNIVFPAGKGMPHLRLAQFLWRTLKVRLPGLVSTTRALNTGVLKLSNISRQVKAHAHERWSDIKQALAAKNNVIDQRDAWASLLALQGFRVDMVGENQGIYDKIYKNDLDIFTQHWLVREYGNFPVSIDGNGQLTRILELWPHFYANKVAIYAMYPSLDSEKAFVTQVLNDGIFNFNHTLKYLIELGAQDWNVKRVVDLGVSREHLQYVDKNELTKLCLLWGNTAVLKAIDYRPAKVDLNDPESVDNAAFKLSAVRRDMWPYMVSKDAAEVVIPVAMEFIRANDL